MEAKVISGGRIRVVRNGKTDIVEVVSELSDTGCRVQGVLEEDGTFRVSGCLNDDCTSECELQQTSGGSTAEYWCTCKRIVGL